MKYISHQFYYRYWAALCLASLPVGCGDAPTPGSPETAGIADNVVRVDNLYFAGQPDRAGLEAARQAGVELVIDMRVPGETDWNEAAVAGELGLRYVNLPIARSGTSFDPDIIESLHRLVAENGDRQVLLHCSSGNRVGAWYAVYLVEQKGMPLEQALTLAGEAGLSRAATADRVREYLGAK